MDPKTLFVEYALPLLATALTSLLALALKALVTWLNSKAEGSKLAAVAAKVAHFSELVVTDLEHTVKPELEKALADGKLTDEEKEGLKALALERLKALLADSGMKELKGVMGILTPQLELYLSGAIEKALVGVKTQSPF